MTQQEIIEWLEELITLMEDGWRVSDVMENVSCMLKTVKEKGVTNA